MESESADWSPVVVLERFANGSYLAEHTALFHRDLITDVMAPADDGTPGPVWVQEKAKPGQLRPVAPYVRNPRRELRVGDVVEAQAPLVRGASLSALVAEQTCCSSYD